MGKVRNTAIVIGLAGTALLGILRNPLHGQKSDPLASILPVPEKMTRLTGEFIVDGTITVGTRGASTPRAFKGAARFMSRLAGRTGFFLDQDFLKPHNVIKEPDILYTFKREGRLVPHEDESYGLRIEPEGVVLEAVTDIGVLRGFETLLQLLTVRSDGYVFPCLEVRDKPRFTWRGLLIDSGRHFHPVAIIKRNLDAMAAVKLNVFHWHLTEDQGFRIESKIFPDLHRLGSDGMFYTQSQIRDIIAYAADRGIRVMPEFDLPGHSTSWFVAFPQFSSYPGKYSIERTFGVQQPAFNPAEEEVYDFLDKFFGEMAALFPDPYLHIGGDEVEGKHWDANPAIQLFKEKNRLADNHALQAYFNKRLLEILTRHGKKMVGWDEIFQPGLPTDIVIQSWRGQKALVDSARRGYQGILSNGYYIDLCYPAEDHYLNDPIPEDSLLDENQKNMILGGEATMWSELISPETIDSRIWPRTAAIAERLWSPQSVRDVEDMYRRLSVVSLHLEELGITHLKNQDMMLRRLARSRNIRALKVLADVTEPLKRYRRHSQGVTYTFLSPLTRFVDACQPESLGAREFRKNVSLYLESRDSRLGDDLALTLSAWAANHDNILEHIRQSPALREVEPLSKALSDCAGLGLEALDFLGGSSHPSSDWLEKGRALLTEARQPKAHAELAVLAGIEKLMEACSRPGGH